MIAIFLAYISKIPFYQTLLISNIIGISILIANISIGYKQYTRNIFKIIVVSLLGLIIGISIIMILDKLFFNISIDIGYLFITGLFFGVLAISLAWLYFNKRNISDNLEKIRNKLNNGKELKWIKASNSKGINLINTSNIIYFQSEQKYTLVVTNQAEYLINTSIKDLLQQLNKDDFWQINRGVIVNVNYIKVVNKNNQGKLVVILENQNIDLIIGRKYINLFKKM
ncbi:Response regulator VCA0850 [hydrothermal vent metagenome]|uniref:Response regulator VCA0850 n=1 Tax=hydrothermal vent metagenome TaxID=652676 RepID=A0A1W1BPS6_9ZZZZ